jgi:hypothetical protein
MSRSINRRELIELGGKLGIVAAGGAILGNHLMQPVAAQDSTPEAAAFPPAGIPVIDISLDDAGAITAPAESTAGTTLVRVTAPMEFEYVTLALVVRPEDVTDEDFAAAFMSEAIPEWLHASPVISVEFAPGAQGGVGELVAELAPGTWHIVNLSAETIYTTIEITGEPVTVEIAAAVSVALDHHDFKLPAEVPSGDQVWQVTNVDPVLHHMVIFSTPHLLTDEEMMGALSADPEASPVPGAPEPLAIMPAGGTGVISQGQTIYQIVALTPGTYTAVCFISDPGEGMPPHFVMGMIESFTAI